VFVTGDGDGGDGDGVGGDGGGGAAALPLPAAGVTAAALPDEVGGRVSAAGGGAVIGIAPGSCARSPAIPAAKPPADPPRLACEIDAADPLCNEGFGSFEHATSKAIAR